MALNQNTFTRLVAAGFNRIMQSGEFALRLAGTLNGLLPDLMVDAGRQVMRWSMPLDDTPVDMLVHLCRIYGLPYYIESYDQTIDRLRRAWSTHTVAGSMGQLVEELEWIGLENVVLLLETERYNMTVQADNVGATAVLWGDFVFGDGTVFGVSVPYSVKKNFPRLMRYFKPACIRFLDFQQTP